MRGNRPLGRAALTKGELREVDPEFHRARQITRSSRDREVSINAHGKIYPPTDLQASRLAADTLKRSSSMISVERDDEETNVASSAFRDRRITFALEIPRPGCCPATWLIGMSSGRKTSMDWLGVCESATVIGTTYFCNNDAT